jgi:hypothetical protein
MRRARLGPDRSRREILRAIEPPATQCVQLQMGHHDGRVRYEAQISIWVPVWRLRKAAARPRGWRVASNAHI